MIKIQLTEVKGGVGLDENERLELGRLLLRAGYMVKMHRERPAGRDTGKYTHYAVCLGPDEAAATGEDTTGQRSFL